MHKSSLLDIIRTFSKEELKKFEDFIRSPYFNKKETLIDLFLLIKKSSRAFDDENLKKENAWKTLFPGSKYNYGIMKNLIFDLNKLAEQFIVISRFNNEEFKKNEYLIMELLSRGLKNNYISKNNLLKKELSIFPANSQSPDIGSYINLLTVLSDRQMFYSHMYEHNDIDLNFQVQRDSYHITRLLLLLFGGYNDVEVFSHSRNAKLDSNPVTIFLNALSEDFEKIIDALNETSEQNQIYIRVNYLMYLAISQSSIENYLNFKKTFFENIRFFPKADMHDMHYCLITAAAKAESKQLSLSREIVEIFDSMSENGIIIEQETDKIPLYIFNLYITNSFLLLDSEKLEAFRNKFINKIESEHYENSDIYINFMLSFLNKKFDEALNFFSQLDIPHLFLKIPLRYQKAMCSYEINDYEMFLNDHDSLKHFLKNNEFVSNDQKSMLNNYFNNIHKLFKLKDNFSEFELLNLKKDVDKDFKSSNLWFSQKIKEIEKANLNLG